LLEDRRGIIRDDINTAELLAEHDDPSGPRCTPVARDGEKLGELGEEVLSFVNPLFDFNSDERIVKVSRCLKLRLSD
jgi:hypothetical protein